MSIRMLGLNAKHVDAWIDLRSEFLGVADFNFSSSPSTNPLIINKTSNLPLFVHVYIGAHHHC